MIIPAGDSGLRKELLRACHWLPGRGVKLVDHTHTAQGLTH